MDNMEQTLAKIRDTLPRMWYAFYQGSVAAGFTTVQLILSGKTWKYLNEGDG